MNNTETKLCKKCKEIINKKATKCPHCGAKQGVKVWLIILIILVLIGILSPSDNSSDNDNSNNNSTNNQVQIKEKFTHTITDEYNDTFTHYIEGTVKNNRDKDYSYVQIEFICYDKNGNNIGTAIDNTNNLLGGQTWKFKAMGLFVDTTADHCEFYEITGW